MAGQDEHIAVRGRQGIVEYAVRNDGSMPAKQFVDALPLQVRLRLLAIFGHVANSGGVGVSPKLFKHERSEIWTFKGKVAATMLRLPCFQRGNRWIITHGFCKTSSKSKWPEQEFTKAFAIMSEVVGREEDARKSPTKDR